MSRAGSWCNVEIPSTSLDRSKKFYSAVFGWRFVDVPGMDYAAIVRGGPEEMGGGLWNPPAGVPRVIVNYIRVENIDETLRDVERHGGKCIRPRARVPDSGWFALVADVDGNILGLWEGETAQSTLVKGVRVTAKRRSKPRGKSRK